MLHKWKLLKSEWALNEKWYKVRRDTVEIKPGKIIDDYYISILPEVVMIIGVTPDGKVPLIKQYKHGVGDIIIELPAGLIDEGEDPLLAAKREFQEEAGYTSTQWESLGYFSTSSQKPQASQAWGCSLVQNPLSYEVCSIASSPTPYITVTTILSFQPNTEGKS